LFREKAKFRCELSRGSVPGKELSSSKGFELGGEKQETQSEIPLRLKGKNETETEQHTLPLLGSMMSDGGAGEEKLFSFSRCLVCSAM
jgi:hypothetical protein